ncbi:hypothetical protein V6U81_22645 [Micromonospora sp. CPCC 205711]|uniref:hypothetical protein n=1 Tax=Micromonospora sp. CPCC 205547 TaxID=3122400 RepID=UPI002FF3EF89
MLPVATIHPAWVATLRVMRDLVRLAMTALVLAVGLGAAVAGPSGPAAAGSAPVRPSVVASRVADLPATTPSADVRVDDSSAGPLPARPAATSVHPAPPATTVRTPAADPVRGAAGRRGPPRH